MEYGYKEVRRLTGMDLRALCIENNWYTGGTISEYSDLLNKVDEIENVTTDHIVEIATDIMDHSHIHPDMIFTDIMYAIAEKCVSYFTEA